METYGNGALIAMESIAAILRQIRKEPTVGRAAYTAAVAGTVGLCTVTLQIAGITAVLTSATTTSGSV